MHSNRMKKIRRSKNRKGNIKLDIASKNDTVGERIIVGIKYDVHARYMTVCKRATCGTKKRAFYATAVAQSRRQKGKITSKKAQASAQRKRASFKVV